MQQIPPTVRRPLSTLPEAALLARVSQDTMRRMIKAGRLRAVRVGAQWRIPADEIDRLLGEGTNGR